MGGSSMRDLTGPHLHPESLRGGPKNGLFASGRAIEPVFRPNHHVHTPYIGCTKPGDTHNGRPVGEDTSLSCDRRLRRRRRDREIGVAVQPTDPLGTSSIGTGLLFAAPAVLSHGGPFHTRGGMQSNRALSERPVWHERNVYGPPIPASFTMHVRCHNWPGWTLGAALVLICFCVLVPGVAAANVATGSFQIASVGETVSIPIVLDSASGGISGYRITVSLSDPSVATITAVTFPDWAGLKSASALPAGQAVLQAVDLSQQVPVGATGVLLATLTVKGTATGSTGIVITPDPSMGFQARNGDMYSVTTIPRCPDRGHPAAGHRSDAGPDRGRAYPGNPDGDHRRRYRRHGCRRWEFRRQSRHLKFRRLSYLRRES